MAKAGQPVCQPPQPGRCGLVMMITMGMIAASAQVAALGAPHGYVKRTPATSVWWERPRALGQAALALSATIARSYNCHLPPSRPLSLSVRSHGNNTSNLMVCIGCMASARCLVAALLFSLRIPESEFKSQALNTVHCAWREYMCDYGCKEARRPAERSVPLSLEYVCCL